MYSVHIWSGASEAVWLWLLSSSPQPGEVVQLFCLFNETSLHCKKTKKTKQNWCWNSTPHLCPSVSTPGSWLKLRGSALKGALCAPPHETSSPPTNKTSPLPLRRRPIPEQDESATRAPLNACLTVPEITIHCFIPFPSSSRRLTENKCPRKSASPLKFLQTAKRLGFWFVFMRWRGQRDRFSLAWFNRQHQTKQTRRRSASFTRWVHELKAKRRH